MFIIPYALVYWGEVYISSGLAAVLFSTQSLFVVLFSHYILKDEKANPYKYIGLLLGLCGLFLVFHGQINWLNRWGYIGMAGILLAAVSGGFALVWLRKHGENVDPVPEVTAQLAVTAVAFVLLSLIFESNQGNLFSYKLWMSIMYLAIFGTAVAFVIYFWMAKYSTAIFTSFSVFITPLFAVFLGWIILHENLGVKGIWGTVLVLTSVVITQKK